MQRSSLPKGAKGDPKPPIFKKHLAVTSAVVLAIGVASLHQRDAKSEPMAVDGAPSGMVVFVSGGVCPPGWLHSYEVEGRILVGTVDKAEIGDTVGSPFEDREERLHHHAWAGTIELPKKNIAGANGGNQSGASKGTYAVAGVTSDAESGLPFVQMEGCVKP